MKAITITKKYRNGVITHAMIVDSDDEMVLADAAADWCESDASGQAYGYSWEWDIIQDPKEIARIAGNEILDNNKRIANLQKYNEKLAALIFETKTQE